MAQALALDLLIEWDLDWTARRPRTTWRDSLDVSTGVLTLKIAGEELWGTDDPDWPWIELLEWLARSWIWLRGEDGLPLAVESYLGSSPVDSLRALKSKLAQGTFGEPSAGRTRAEMSLWDFLETHDLSRALAGADSPSIVFWREGLIGHVLTDENHYVTGWPRILETLNSIGDRIVSRLELLSDADRRAQAVLAAWASRNDVPASRWIEVARGQGDPDSALPLPPHWQDLGADEVERSPILAAARMTSRLSVGLAETILQKISAMPLNHTRINEISAEVADFAQVDADAPPWDQAHEYARAFRLYTGCAEDQAFRPEPWLASIGVSVHDLRLGSKDIEAIAAWGPRNGPAILINRDGRASSRPSGRNASLAHEIGHLLMDRAEALPAAEVLGGRVDPFVERRARAFAAEVLLPRTTAGALLSNAGTWSEARGVVASLSNRYGVSHEIVAWQARNSGEFLSADVLEHLRSLVRHQERF